MAERDFDIAVYGATGFAGRFFESRSHGSLMDQNGPSARLAVLQLSAAA